MTEHTSDAQPTSVRTAASVQLIRSACHLIIVVVVAIWAFTDWAFPWPALLTGTGATVLSILIWALFLSPKPVLHTDKFGQSLIELLFIASGTGAMLAIGAPWILAIAFAVIAAVVGYLVVSRQNRAAA